jgi:O-antigen ligase
LIWCRPLDLLDVGVGALFVTHWLAAAIQGDWWGNLSVWGLGYLVLLYHLGRSIIGWFSVGQVERAALWFGGVLTLTIVLSWGYLFAFPTGGWELAERRYLPSLGFFWRIEALTMSPNMLMNMLTLPVLVVMAAWWRSKRPFWLILASLFLLGTLSTFSKSLVLLLPVLFWGAIPKSLLKGWRILGVVLTVVVVVFFVLATKAIWVPKDFPGDDPLWEQSYMTPQVIWSGDRYSAFATMHYRMNQEAWIAFRSSPVFGIGPARFTSWVDIRKEAGLYPADKLSYGPHSLYLGTLAESGLVGGLGLLFFLYALARTCYRRWYEAPDGGRWLLQVLIVYLLFWGLEGLAMDTLHFRQFWWTLAVVAGWGAIGAAGSNEADTRNCFGANSG